jgi:opacity protein-like surface antigen
MQITQRNKVYVMKILIISVLLYCLSVSASLFSQEAALKMNNPIKTFATMRVVIGQSVDIAPQGEMNLNIQHHFGPVNTGFTEFFGFDQAATRIGLDYSFNKWLSIGLGRSTIEKTWDGSAKMRLLQQKHDESMPIGLTYFVNMGINGLSVADSLSAKFEERISYVHQLIVARKIGKTLSLQIVSTLLHRNVVDKAEDENDVFTIGTGASFNLSKRINLNFEYHYILSPQAARNSDNSFSFGVDIKTAGHVFQVFLTNSQGLLEQHFLTSTKGNWLNGDIRIGFNIVRMFTLKQKDYF